MTAADALLAAKVAVILCISLLFRARFNSFLNPPSVHAAAFLGQLGLYWVMQAFALDQGLHFAELRDANNIVDAYLIATVSFSLPWLLIKSHSGFLRVDSSTRDIIDLKNLRLILLMEMLLLGLTWLFSSAWIGFPLAAMLAGTLDVQQMQENAKMLPAGLLALNLWLGILLSLHLASALVLRKHYQFPYRLLIAMVLMIVFSGLWLAKRQVILIMLVFVALIVAADRASRSILNPRVLLLGAGFASFFITYVALQYIRVANIQDELFYMELVLSSMWPLLNLDAVMSSPDGVSWQLNGLIAELIPHRLYGHGIDAYKDLLFEPTSSLSYVLFAYTDFGVIGIAAAAFWLGLVTVVVSQLYRSNMTGLQIRVFVLWICLSSPIYSHGFSLNFFLVPLFLLMFLRLASGTRSYSRAEYHAV